MARTKVRKRASGTHKLVVAVKAHPYLTVLIVGLVVAVTAGSVYTWMYPQTVNSFVDSANNELGVVYLTGKQAWSGFNVAPIQEVDYAVEQDDFIQSKFALPTIRWTVTPAMKLGAMFVSPGEKLPMDTYTVTTPGQIITLSDTTAVLMIQNTSVLVAAAYDTTNSGISTYFPHGSARRVALKADPGAPSVGTCGLKSSYSVDMTDRNTKEFSDRLPFAWNLGGVASFFASKVNISTETGDNDTCYVQMTNALGQLVMGAEPDGSWVASTTKVPLTRIQ